MAVLRRRYTEGELTEEELDLKVERLLETEQRAATEPELAGRLTE